MSGYPPPNHGYGYGGNQPSHQPPYSSGGSPPPYGSPSSAPYAVPYGAAPSAPPYAPPPGDKPPKEKPYEYGGPPAQNEKPYQYGGPPPPTVKPYEYGGPQPPKEKPGHGGYGAPPPSGYGGYGNPPPPAYGGYGGPPSGYGGYGAPPQPAPYGSPFASLVPSGFPPGTDPNIVACFQAADQDGSGAIDDKELQSALSSYNQSFSLRTVHLLMYLFTNSNARKIGPKEFTALFYSLQNWRTIFERFDRDRSGKIDVNELRDALLSLGYSVSPAVLDLLMSKYDKNTGRNKAIEYDNFIECCLTIKGLTEKFKEKDTSYCGSATFTYEAFMLAVLPFLLA